MYLTVGGIEPRKGSRYLVEALGRLKAMRGPRPMLAVVGGHSFQDYQTYRDEVLGSLASHGLRLGDDVVLVGTVPDAELPGWFGAADSFVFPSISEGWGLVVLEALAAGLPVVASDIEVFREFLTHDVDAVLTEAANPSSLAAGMARVRDDPELVRGLRVGWSRYGGPLLVDQHRPAPHGAVRRGLLRGLRPRGLPRRARPRQQRAGD